jgi:tetratricopeptide (TPR) repeat protein
MDALPRTDHRTRRRMTLPESLRRRLPPALLALSVAAAFGRTVSYPFITHDDPDYLHGNPVVAKGLSAEGVAWAFRSLELSNWHPLAWLSHMADVSLFGFDAAGHHAVNVALHAFAALLLYSALAAFTGARGRSLAAAALFALHPLRVEAVAWVSERKELLCATFLLLALHAYGRYARRPSAGRYAALLCAFALSLLSKPTAVTFPFLLLLLDYWPLRRFPFSPPGEGAEGEEGRPAVASTGRLLAEKAPLLLLSAASSAVTWVAQARGGSVGEAIPLSLKLENALVSAAAYLGKSLFPSSLSFFYPHPSILGETVPPWKWGGAALLLAAVTAAALRERERRPFLLVGWLWFLGALVPVSGVVTVGLQSMADRYTYLPAMGLSVAAAWTASSLLPSGEGGRKAGTALAVAASLLLAVAAWRQAGYWRTPSVLFEHAVAAGGDSSRSRELLGTAYLAEGRFPECAQALEASLRMYPLSTKAWRNLALCRSAEGRHADAAEAYRGLLRIVPADLEGWNELGKAWGKAKRYDLALEAFRKVTELAPRSGEGWYNRGAAALLAGERREAEESLGVLASLDPAAARDLAALIPAEGK